MNNSDLLHKIAISKIPKIGPVLARRLVSYSGSIEGVFKESKKSLSKIPGLGVQLVNSIIQSNPLKEAEDEFRFIEKNKISTVFYLDESYPERLRHCEDAPIILYYKGKPKFNSSKIISIVGTRTPTDLGLELCRQFVEDLAKNYNEMILVSGLAYGIDIHAHRAALDYNIDTFAILGHGLDIIYPAVHKKVADQIINQGAIITEFSSNSKRDKAHFIRRNRIIAGLSDATIVMESDNKGGSLITADIAQSYNRDVFAFPGRTSDKKSNGCNNLIKFNKAGLIESAKDLEYFMGWESSVQQDAVQTRMFNDFTDDEKEVLQLLKSNEVITIDKLCLLLEKPTSVVSPVLLNLEFAGVVKTLPGKQYKLTTQIIL